MKQSIEDENRRGLFKILSHHFPIESEEKHGHGTRTGYFQDLKQCGWRGGRGGKKGKGIPFHAMKARRPGDSNGTAAVVLDLGTRSR
jgi:hypothetical protein